MWRFGESSHSEVFVKISIFKESRILETTCVYNSVFKKVAVGKPAASPKITFSEFFSRTLLCVF